MIPRKLLIFLFLIGQVWPLPQDKLRESYSDDTTILYDEMGMPIRPGFDQKQPKNSEDPFKPVTGHKPGGLPMISDAAFSLTILIYVSVAFLLIFFLFCWKTNGQGSNPEDLKQQCPLMVNDPPEPKGLAEPSVIPPTPTSDKRLK